MAIRCAGGWRRRTGTTRISATRRSSPSRRYASAPPDGASRCAGPARRLPAVELAAALLLVRHAAGAVAELAAAAAAGPELVVVRIERLRQRRAEALAL